MKPPSTGILFAFIATGAAQLHPAPLDLGKVSAKSNFVAHLDFEAARDTSIGKFLLAEIKKDPTVERQLAGVKAAFGLDLEGLGQLTVYGRGEKDKGIAVASGGFNVQQLEGFLSLSDNLETSKYKGGTIYATNDGAAAIVGKDTVVAGSGVDFVKHGLDVLAGSQTSLGENRILEELAKAVPSPVASATANLLGIAEFSPVSGPEAAILKKADLIGLSIGEAEGQVRAAAVLQAADEETAKHLENVLRGLTSLISLGADLDPEIAELAAKVKTYVGRDGRFVRAYLGISAELVMEKLAEEIAKKKAPKAQSSVLE